MLRAKWQLPNLIACEQVGQTREASVGTSSGYDASVSDESYLQTIMYPSGRTAMYPFGNGSAIRRRDRRELPRRRAVPYAAGT